MLYCLWIPGLLGLMYVMGLLFDGQAASSAVEWTWQPLYIAIGPAQARTGLAGVQYIFALCVFVCTLGFFCLGGLACLLGLLSVQVDLLTLMHWVALAVTQLLVAVCSVSR